MSIFLKCEEANHTCDKSQYKEASFLELIMLNIHLIYCRACQKYTARNTKLTKFVQKTKIQSMTKNDKVIIKERLKQEMAQ
jgi:hypothetical protein